MCWRCVIYLMKNVLSPNVVEMGLGNNKNVVIAIFFYVIRFVFDELVRFTLQFYCEFRQNND